MKNNFLKITIGVLIFFLVCTITSRGLYAFKLANVTFTQAKMHTITHKIQTQGRIQSNSEFIVLVKSGLIVSKVDVKTGDFVKVGQALFSVDANYLNQKLTELQSQVKSLELQIVESVNAENIKVNTEQIRKNQAHETYQQTVDKCEKNVATALEELNQAQYDLDTYTNDQEIENEKIKQLNQNLSEKTKNYEAAIQNQQSELLLARQGIENASVFSPDTTVTEQLQIQKEQVERDLEKLSQISNNQGIVNAAFEGVITKISVTVGEPTPETACVFIADNSSGTKIQIQVSEEEEKYISKDCKITLTGKAVDGKEITTQNATISSIIESTEAINPYKENTSQSNKYFDVLIVSDENKFLIGTNIFISIEKKSQNYNTAIPIQALHQDGVDEYFVWIVTKRNAMLGEELISQKLSVRVIDKDSAFAALEENSLTSEQRLIHTSDKALQEGSTVREKVIE